MSEEWSYARFGDRFVGDFADGMIAFALALATYLLIERPLFGVEAGFFEDGAFGITDGVVLLWCLWNMTYLVGTTGQSWGRRFAGIKVVDAHGHPVGFWRVLGRNVFAMYISAPLFYLGFLWVIWDSNKQAWHDKVFRTFVIRRVA